MHYTLCNTNITTILIIANENKYISIRILDSLHLLLTYKVSLRLSH